MANEQICFAIVDKKKDGKVIASAILLNHFEYTYMTLSS